MNSKKEFENYSTRKCDDIDNAAFDLINAFMDKGDGAEIEWDMEIIGEVTEAVEGVLKSKGFEPCFPWTSDDEPCYTTDECNSANCPFKKKS